MSLSELLALSQEQVNVIKAAIYAAFIYLGIDVDVVKILLWLIMIDSALGIVRTVVLRQTLSFKVLLWGLITKVMTLAIPITVALLAKGIGIDLTGFVVLIMNVLLVSESFSVMTNMLSIRTKKKIENTDYISKLLESIRLKFGNMLERYIKKSQD